MALKVESSVLAMCVFLGKGVFFWGRVSGYDGTLAR